MSHTGFIRRTMVRALAVIIFVGALLLGMALASTAVWGDLEAALFDAAIRADAPLPALRCPVLMTTAESPVVRASFTNSLDRPIERFVRARISFGYATLMREVNTRLPLAPGETQQLEWTVTADDAAFGRFVLVRVHAFRSAPLPSRSSACGIMVANVPYLTGSQVVTLILVLSLLSMGSGIGLWIITQRPLTGRYLEVAQAMGLLAGIVSAAIIAGLLGWWAVGVVILAFTVLLIGIIIERFVLSS